MRPLKKKPITVMRNKIKVKKIGKKEGGGGEKEGEKEEDEKQKWREGKIL